MKRLFVLVVEIMTVTLYFNSSVSAELTLQYHEDDCSFVSVFFIDSEKGWVCGGPNKLLRTLDGGETWERLYLPERYEMIRNVTFMNKNMGVCLAFNQASIPKYLYSLFLTKDGGESWIKPTDLPDSVVSYSFYDENIGWAGCWLSGNWQLFKTTDGGESWMIIREEKESYWLDLLDIACEDENTCWVLHGRYYDGKAQYSYTYLDVTRNGGQDWEQVKEVQEISYRTLERISLDHPFENIWLLGRTDRSLFFPKDGYYIYDTDLNDMIFNSSDAVWSIASYNNGKALFHFYEHPDYENHDCFLYTSDYGRTFEQFYIIPTLYNEKSVVSG